MMLLHYFVKPTLLLNWLFYQTGWYTCSCLLMLVQYKVDFVRVPNYTVTVQNMSFSFGVLCHMNCQRMNKKTQHKLKLHVKKLGCSEWTVNITHNYVQVKVWSDLPSEIFIIHVADKWGLGCEDVWLDFNICSCHL